MTILNYFLAIVLILLVLTLFRIVIDIFASLNAGRVLHNKYFFNCHFPISRMFKSISMGSLLQSTQVFQNRMKFSEYVDHVNI
jgi:hypothetical protein